MIRHGMVEPSAAGASPPATDPRVPMVTTDAERRASGPAPSPQHRAEAHQSGLSVSIAALPGDDRAIADISRKSKSP
ncbi:hypothetical protein GA829_36125 (plasmid) [Mesorhizobium sp. INR15]|nr:hypothetical protein GA829_03115 [Mesorhizobium sp. INR15]QPC90469.1 hypothetical protein GA829_07620 [Mesorhizobium sp. INR15]QPC94596.1 hypothetical protein GA829_30560 [Mesorhizobium sp. INR15]QPC95848.1 hypothetical protein GA829_35490 [Mesorhizobium sp. INR15]QPC95941.1 hypothetical protein GA829_36125 [Mesorhizobium sp. INR15]